jgi:predicted transglutaminase-like cysteine proteinase
MPEQGINENIVGLSGGGRDRRTGSAITRRAAIAAVLSLSLRAFTQPSYAGSDDENVLPPLGHTQFCTRYPHDCDRTSAGTLRAFPLGNGGRS